MKPICPLKMQKCLQNSSPSPDQHRSKLAGPASSTASIFQDRTMPGRQYMTHCDPLPGPSMNPTYLVRVPQKARPGPIFFSPAGPRGLDLASAAYDLRYRHMVSLIVSEGPGVWIDRMLDSFCSAGDSTRQYYQGWPNRFDRPGI